MTKRMLLMCMSAGALAAAIAWAQPVPDPTPEAREDVEDEAAMDEAGMGEDVGTGDAWLDARLADIDLYAARHRAAFTDELVRYHDAPRALVETLLAREAEGWSPGEIYMACALAQVAGRPCRAVVTRRDADRAVPWSELAGQFDAAPGSAPFQRLKRGVVQSYRHWARPLELDAELRASIAADGA